MSLVQSLDRLYQRHRQQFFNCALNIAHCPMQAEDAVHNAFVKLFALPAEPRNLKHYAFRAVRNAALDLRRSQNRFTAALDITETDLSGPASSNPDQGDREQLETALASLSHDEREVILLHLQSDLKFREIARILEYPLGTVVSWYRRGLHKLRQKMETEHERFGTTLTTNTPTPTQ